MDLVAANIDLGLLILRVGLAIVFLVHGLPKAKNVSQVAGFFGQLSIPVPTVSAWIVTLLETVGSVLLAVGLGTQVLGAFFAFNMFVAIRNAKIGMMKAGFTGQGGWEFEFALLVGGLALMFAGAGAISLDALL
jgi:uncharacterized membrane protein YphA (DoxX/SURF4 family)